MVSPVKIWRNQKHIVRLVGKPGTILSWTFVRVPPGNFSNQAPYPVALVVLESGVRLCAQLVDWDQSHLRIGQKVLTVVRRVAEPSTEGIIPYGIKVKPV